MLTRIFMMLYLKKWQKWLTKLIMNISYRIPEILSRSFGTKFFLLLLIGTVIASCNESSVVGLDVQPQGDLLNVGWVDTTTIIAKTIKEDSLHSDNSILVSGEALIGTYMDPVFGNVSSSLYTQLRLPSNNPVFGTSPVPDSVVLVMVYSPTVYGKKERLMQKVNVYQLNEGLAGNSYYSNNSVPYNITNDLANNYSFIPRPLDSVTVLGKKVKPQLRIPLELQFGQVILNRQGDPELANNEAFQDFTKGLYITTENTSYTPSSGQGNIMHFKMADPESKLVVYYHNSDATNNDSLKYEISLASVIRFSKFNHDYTSGYSYLQSQLNGTSTIDTTVFVQALGGTKVKIEFPYLKNINDSGKIAINKAELVIKVDTANSLYQLDTFAAPARLVLFGIKEDGSNYVIPDVYEANQSVGGSYNSSSKEYVFYIERYIQQVLNGTLSNTGLYLVVSGGAVNANRVVIGGGKNKGYQKMKLNLTYTKLH